MVFTAKYNGINSFLVGAATLLLENGVKRQTRGFNCWELPNPFIFMISNPTARIVTIPQRKWNSVLPFAESLWLASGRNDLGLIGHYLKNMKNFSDDDEFIRGGYGPRIRRYNGSSDDYKISDRYNDVQSDVKNTEIDQFEYIIQDFKRDLNTRRAIISIGDTNKDCFNKNGTLLETKDYPCTRNLHFMKHPSKNKLNLVVNMRSNDIMWGASAVNIFNFTFMQEYFAKILNLEIGDYYHVINNFHFYENHRDQLEDIANVQHYNDIGFGYTKKFKTLNEFDNLVDQLAIEERRLRTKQNSKLIEFEDDFFNDWYKMLYFFNTKKEVVFTNPILTEIIKTKSN